MRAPTSGAGGGGTGGGGAGGGGAGLCAARALSYGVNPFVLPPLLVGLVLARFGAPPGEIGLAVGISLACFGAAPLAYVAWMVRRGLAGSLMVPERRNRRRPLVAGLAAAAAGALLLGLTGVTVWRLVAALAVLHLLNVAVLTAITLRWKISLHTSSLAGFAALLLTVAYAVAPALAAPLPSRLLEGAGLAALVLVPPLAWARVRLRAHTVAQAVGGVAFGLVLPPLELLVALEAGWLAG